MVDNASTSISFKDAVVILELGYHNRELSFLLFNRNKNILLPLNEQQAKSTILPGDERRTKVDKVLNNPEDYLDSLQLTLSSIYCITEDIVDFSKKCNININLLSANDVPNDDIHYYIFHYFSDEAINITNSLLSKKNSPIDFINLDISIKYVYSFLTQLKADLLITISRFEEYVKNYPTAQSRNELIKSQYIDTTYD